MINSLGYLSFARELLNSQNNLQQIDEVKVRTAVNRAYYAVYLYTAKNYITSGNHLTDKRSHAELIYQLKHSDNKALKTIGNQLSTLKEDREIADYHPEKNFSKSTAEKSYSQAIRIITKVDSTFSTNLTS